MNINKHIIDQRLNKIVNDNPSWFADIDKSGKKGNEAINQKIAKAFVMLAVSTFLEIELIEAKNLLTEGGNDVGVDAIYIGEVNDYEFPVIIFQGKYVFDLEKDSNFPANSILRVINAVSSIFDPSKPVLMNEDLKPKVEEIRSLIGEGFIPTVKCICVNNGLKWNKEGDNHILNAGFTNHKQVQFEHFTHDDIIKFLQNTKGVKANLHFSGKSVIDDFNYKRVLIGKVNITEFAQLFDNHGDILLERNIRRYLGLNKNRVNEKIKETLLSDKKENFYFYNNGVTIVCSKFSYNALQGGDWNVMIDEMQVINGGQSCKTIQQTVSENPQFDYSQVYVLVRLYELGGEDVDDLITDITIATNSQNPVDLRDLRANDELQKKLELAIKDLRYNYKRKKDNINVNDSISSSVVAEAVLTIWHRKPHLAKFKGTELFGKFYDEIFKDLNAAQAVLAVLIYRFCDNQRRKIDLYESYPHLPYSNYFMAMLIGDLILKELKISKQQLTHKNFAEAKAYFEKESAKLFEQANEKLISALKNLLPQEIKEIELRRLSATFRRGDLLEFL